MIRQNLKSLTALSLVLLALAACGRGGPPAPIEHRGVGSGETSPNMAATSTYNSPAPIQGGTYTPPPGYGSRAPVQAQTLGEPNDGYAQAANTSTTPAGVRMNPPPATPYNPHAVVASQPGQPQVLGTMPANTPVTSGVPVNAPVQPAREPLLNSSGATTTTTTTTTSSTIDQGTGDYGWPLRGRLISGFGAKADGQSNDGLNIAAPLGTSVYASKDGTVAYAGNELRSFGNMVLVRHPGGMFTVYAHLDQIYVTKEAPITKGQVVGTVGQSGGVSEPQLHFEVRRGSNPQDPMKYLSR